MNIILRKDKVRLYKNPKAMIWTDIRFLSEQMRKVANNIQSGYYTPYDKDNILLASNLYRLANDLRAYVTYKTKV